MSTPPTLAELHALRISLSSKELDQGHLFAGWPDSPAEYTPKQRGLLTELHKFTLDYPGGVEQYIRNGKRLLEADREAAQGSADATGGITALEMPSLIFTAPDVFTRSPLLTELETLGAELVKRCVFVLVAGGLGERLGYSSIKVGLPVETSTERTYLEHYLSWAKAAAGSEVPFVIMTSDDTHSRTVELIESLQMDMPNLRLLKQETVFCFADGDAHLALSTEGSLLRKPHGHGDVHSLIFSAKAAEGSTQSLTDSWLSRGCEYIVFLQDTNAPATITIPISLAISERERLDMSFTSIPRQPKEAIGLLCRSRRPVNGPDGKPKEAWRTSVVEYNVFQGVAAALTPEGGDVPAQGSEFSPFPGSINTLVLKLAPYARQLAASHGAVPEFINPKYADASRRVFKKPARVESLMQDVALLFSEENARVGATVFDRFTYQPVKNALVDACDKARQGMNPYCATSGEAGFYELTRRRLRAVGLAIDKGPHHDHIDVSVGGGAIKAHLLPIVTLDAAAAAADVGGIGGLCDLSKVFPHPDAVHISPASTLMIEGRVIVESLSLGGVLWLKGPALNSHEAPLVVRGLKVENAKWHARETTGSDAGEVDRIRGFILEKTPPHIVDWKAKL